MRSRQRIVTPQSIFLALLLSVSLGCSGGLKPPNLGGIYNRAAQYHGKERNPVIVMPGILGSKLVDSKSGRIVWGAFGGEYADPSEDEDIRLISLPMKQGVPLAELTDSVVQNGALDRVRFGVLGLPIELNAYANILGSLGVGGYRDRQLGEAGAIDYGSDHYTCFQFAYDWRRDLVESAKRLHEYIISQKAYVEQEHRRRTGETLEDIKFDIVAHSMGGLVTRYYLRYGPVDLPQDGSSPELTWFGAQYVEKVVLIGTPSAGAVESLLTLIEGLPIPLHSDYPAAILDTLPAVYQLMPRPRHRHVVNAADPDGGGLDLYDVELWKKLEWGLADPAQDKLLKAILPQAPTRAERQRIALDHLEKTLKRTKQFHEAVDRPASPPKSLSLYLIAGDAEQTAEKLLVNLDTGSYKIANHAPGDGSVLRSSALMDERVGQAWTPTLSSPVHWTHVTFLFQDHLGLTKDPVFVDNILYLLLEKPAS